MAELSVHYERKFSDQNYGSEGLSMSWTWDTDDVVSDGIQLTDAAQFLRHEVLEQLARSASSAVSYAAQHELKARDPKASHDDEVWRQAEASAEYELAAGLRDNARQDETQEDLPF